MGYKNVSATTDISDDGIAVVTVKGKIVTSLSATAVVGVIESLTRETEVPQIIISLKYLDYIDSYSFNWILNVYRKQVESGGTLALCEPNEDIMELFQITNFGKAIPIYRTEADARDAFKTGNANSRIAC